MLICACAFGVKNVKYIVFVAFSLISKLNSEGLSEMTKCCITR